MTLLFWFVIFFHLRRNRMRNDVNTIFWGKRNVKVVTNID